MTEGMAPQTKYEKQQLSEEQTKRKMKIAQDITVMEGKLRNYKQLDCLTLMDLVQETISACGGEPKVQYSEVTTTFVKAYTRVSMEMNIFPFLPQDDVNNPRFHKVITKIFLLCPAIQGVRWMPNPGAERGAYMMVMLK